MEKYTQENANLEEGIYNLSLSISFDHHTTMFFKIKWIIIVIEYDFKSLYYLFLI